jgi:hypothetical protein
MCQPFGSLKTAELQYGLAMIATIVVATMPIRMHLARHEDRDDDDAEQEDERRDRGDGSAVAELHRGPPGCGSRSRSRRSR